MHVPPGLSRLALHLALLGLGILPVRGVTVLVSYDLTQGSAAIDPLTIPNPQGGEDITITPSLEITTGSFDAVFENGTALGAVGDGAATIRNQTFSGSITIAFSTIIDLGFITTEVTANLSGPLTGTQISDASGSILGDGTIFTNTTPGLFDVTAGPLNCTDSAFGLLCTLLETGLNLDFPIEIPAVDGAPLPFTGTFDGLDTPGASTAGNTFDFSIPIGDANTFGAELDIQWSEDERTVIPEPSAAAFALCLLVFGSRRSRRA